jgi:hypothetical protein
MTIEYHVCRNLNDRTELLGSYGDFNDAMERACELLEANPLTEVVFIEDSTGIILNAVEIQQRCDQLKTLQSRDS